MNKQRTEAQKLASRLNGAKSRGPITPEGKARVARNATKLGLHTRSAVLANEDPAAYNLLLEALVEQWAPETPLEVGLVYEMAEAHWRIQRLKRYETALMDIESLRTGETFRQLAPGGDNTMLNAMCWQNLDESGRLTRLSQHEMRLRRVFDASEAKLVAIQAMRDAADRKDDDDRNPPATQPQATEKQSRPTPPEPSPLKAENKPGPARSALQSKPDSHRPGTPPEPDQTLITPPQGSKAA